jgi:oxygen-independent coproporphyrinogen-3 oxidase
LAPTNFVAIDEHGERAWIAPRGLNLAPTPQHVAPEPAVTGNYFVAAYPPFSTWTEAAAETFRRRLRRAPDDDDRQPLGLYVHVPFCARRCDFCYYLSYDRRGRDTGPYLLALTRELARWADTPLLRGRPLSVVYFGGGTPSLLTADAIRRLMHEMQSVMPWNGVQEASFECAPRSVTAAKVRALREAGITRVSLGVQQLDDGVLEASGRIHRETDVLRAYELLREGGFPVVNVDLIVGLVGQTDTSFDDGLERVIGLKPESVTFYQLEIPRNTPLYRALRDEALEALPVDWTVKRERLGRGFERLEAAGYTLRSAYTAVRDPERHRFLYQDRQYAGGDVLGIGASSFSYLDGTHQQNVASLEGYLEAMRGDGLPLWRAHALTADERMTRELVLQLKLGRVYGPAFSRRHGVDPAQRFAEPLARFQREGLLRLEGGSVVLTRDGLLQADRLLPAFYLPQHRDVRYS